MLTSNRPPQLALEWPATVAHHFDDLEQQHAANLLGMWLFLATEIMFFGGMFAAYSIYRVEYPQAFTAASRTLDVVLGTINTALLLCSSLTMALAVHAAHRGRRLALVGCLLATLMLGSAFLAIKFSEYLHKYHEGHLPLLDLPFVISGDSAGPVQLFYSLYLAMTGFHALHMLIGIALIAWLAWGGWRHRYSQGNYFPVEMLGLYWHFVDVVWIFLFPLLYLIDRSHS